MSTTILVVDDEEDLQPLILGRFRRKIQQGVYQFRFAGNGLEALERIEKEKDIDLVLLDINMPEVDGLTVLGRLPALNPLLGTVMVSAYGDMENIRQAMNRGAFDFICKPIDFRDLETTIDKTVLYTQQLRETQHLKVVDALKTRFFDNITHELRTPLTLILSPVGQLRRQFLQPEELQHGLHYVERNAQKLLQLINQLLDLAKLQSGHLELIPTVGDPGEFIGQIVSEFEPLARERNLTLSFTCNLTGSYPFDATKLERIVHNLLSNALKFTKQGGITVTISGHTSITLTVRDTGVGIPADKLPYIFDRFYQVRTSTQANEKADNSGTGIGLALVKELTELIGGSVTVDSSTGLDNTASGTTFTVQLPFLNTNTSSDDKAILPALPVLDVDSPRKIQIVSGSGWEEGNKPLILIAEDEPDLCEFLANALSDSYRIITALDGLEAWQIARNELPDIVLTDVMMPGLNGYELTHRLKTNPETDHIPVLMLTAKTSQPARLEGFENGADEYITKPFHLDELRLRLLNLVTRQQRVREHYQQQLHEAATPIIAETPEIALFRKLHAIIETHLDDSTFGVDELAREVGMSRRTLHRKLTALANVSITAFIRHYRLNRAAQFLKQGYNVSETTYMTGYDSPAHFCTIFKERYGKTPTEYLSLT